VDFAKWVWVCSEFLSEIRVWIGFACDFQWFLDRERVNWVLDREREEKMKIKYHEKE